MGICLFAAFNSYLVYILVFGNAMIILASKITQLPTTSVLNTLVKKTESVQ